MRGGRTLGASIAVVVAAVAPAASAQVQPPGTNDPGGFRNVLPGGQGETVNAVELGQFLATEQRPASFTTQLGMYNDLIYAAPELRAADLDRYFKSAGFGLPEDAIGSTVTPREGVTIIRDRTHFVPKVYGRTREDTMFGAGYASAQDRIFLMDVLRHTGRAQLAKLIGPGSGDSTIEMDAAQLKVADYSEAELQRMIDEGVVRADEIRVGEGQQLKQDLEAYVAGINKYIAEARTDPRKMPGEYAALGRTLEDWKQTDTVAIASLIGGIFGRGGGEEARAGEALRQAQDALGEAPGRQAFQDFRRREDPEAPVTTHKRFDFDNPGPVDDDAVAVPDAGSVQSRDPVQPENRLPPFLPPLPLSSSGASTGWLQRLQQRGMVFPDQNSNALLVGASHSASGRPLAVMGPQVGYYSPEILMEMELHGPGGLDTRGATFPGISLFVLLGRGRDFSWSATTATTDVVDEFAEELCDPDGGGPKTLDDGYRYKGNCVEFYTRQHTYTILPVPANAPNVGLPRTITHEIKRSVHGPIQGTATVGGKKVAIAEARSTYFHELDSAIAFKRLNNKEVRDPASFQEAMNNVNFAFNWFYVGQRDIAFLQSGWYPRRADGTDPDLMAWGTGPFDWKGFNGDPDFSDEPQDDDFASDRMTFDELPKDANPDQGYIVNWNNKQAPGWRSADDNWVFSSVHRSQRLEDRMRDALANGGKLDLVELTQIMELGATTDLRGWRVYPLLRRMIGNAGNAELEDALDRLDSWRENGAHRRDRDAPRDGFYDEGPAIALMDEWWPRLLRGIFEPTLTTPVLDSFRGMAGFDQPPGGGGSAYFTGWWGYVDKDLRTILSDPVSQPLSRRYCGGGSASSCRQVLLDTLADAVAQEKTDQGTSDIGQFRKQREEIEFTTAGGIDTPSIHWQDRPTFQQVVEVGSARTAAPPGAPARGSQGGGDEPDDDGGPEDPTGDDPGTDRQVRPAVGGNRADRGSLPFTGLVAAAIVLLGLLLGLGGGVLRRRT